jgi:hypothetical protein
LSPAFGQAPQQPHSLSVKVEPAGAGGSTTMDEGSRDKPVDNHLGMIAGIRDTQTQSKNENESLAVTVRNFGPLPDTAEVEWYFVASPAKPDSSKPAGNQESIFDQGSKSVNLAPGGSETIPVQSKDITGNLTRHTKAHMGNRGKIHNNRQAASEQETGSIMSGWMVRVVAGGRVIDSKASDATLEDVAKDDSKLNMLKGH